jgi:hypothetical protein
MHYVAGQMTSQFSCYGLDILIYRLFDVTLEKQIGRTQECRLSIDEWQMNKWEEVR